MAKIKDLGGGACCKKDAPLPHTIDIPSEYEEFKGLLMNAIAINGVPYEKENFIKNQLIENNQIGYDKLADVWASVNVIDKNIYGMPVQIEFTFSTSAKAYKRNITTNPTTDGAYFIQGIPAAITFSKIIKTATDKLRTCDLVIDQNLNAVKTPQIITVRDPDMRLSVLQAIQKQQGGAPAIVVSPEIGEAIKGIPTATPYIVDSVYSYRQQIRDALINKLGTMSANINKRERVQVGEVNATVGQCEDYIYMLIDNFNKQMQSYGLPFEMRLNNSLEELYTESGVS